MSKIIIPIGVSKIVIPNLFVGVEHKSFIITTRIDVVESGWIWKRRRLKVSQTIPLIDDPYHDGEYGTNRILQAKGVEIKAAIDVIADRAAVLYPELVVPEPVEYIKKELSELGEQYKQFNLL